MLGNKTPFMTSMAFALLICSCAKEEDPIPEACMSRDDSALDYTIAYQKAFAHRDYTSRDPVVAEGEVFRFSLNRSGWQTTSGGGLWLNDEEVELVRARSLEAGEYEVRIRVSACEIRLEDGIDCPCRQNEMFATSSLLVLDTFRLVVDSIRLDAELNCEQFDIPCTSTEVFLDRGIEPELRFPYSLEDLQTGVLFDYPLTATEEYTFFDFDVKDGEERISFLFDETVTNGWSEGWHSSNGLSIYVSRR